MKVVIISGGNEPLYKILKEQCENSVIICADKGIEYTYKYNIIPNYIVGDFDSGRLDVLDYYDKINVTIIKECREKDFTDTYRALSLAIEIGASEIVFLAATGTRLDHTFANIGLLKVCLDNKIFGKIIDEHNEIILLNRTTVIKGESGTIFSINPYGSIVHNISLKGAVYPLLDYDLDPFSNLSVSNIFASSEVEISFKDGDLLLLFICCD